MMVVSFILYAIVLLVAILWLKKRKKRLDFPGPPQLPLLGNMLQLDRKYFHKNIVDWAKKYGNVYKMNLIGDEALVVSDPKILHELLVTRGSEFSGRPDYYELNKFSGDGKNIVFSQPTPTWKTMRKLAHSSLKMYDKGLDRIEAISMELINEMLYDLIQNDKKAVNPKPLIYKATMNIIASFLVGRIYKEDSGYFERYIKLEETTLDLGKRRLEGALLGAVPGLCYVLDLLRGPVQRFDTAIRKMYDMVKTEAEKSEADGFSDGLASCLTRAVDRGEISEENLRHIIGDVILGGSLTTTNTLCGMINILANYPEVQEKLHKESSDVLGDRQVTLKDREAMPYHMATLQETLRYTVVLPQGVFHMTTQDTTVAGKPVPAGTTVIFTLFGINHNEKQFPEPSVFRPERFLDEEGKFVPADHPNRRGMNSFGAGPRICLGESLAKGRMFLILAALMQRFRICPEGSVSKDACDISKFQTEGILVPPAFEAKFIPR